ncbi:MAG: hypothetical protein NDI81_14670 [Desulfobacula sp.]|nr:hypothetical protein [Desulfobacula sp.]
MKKFLVSVMAAFMVFAIAGSAAAFSNGSLTAVIYNKTDKEVALDLGSVFNLDFTAQNVTLAAAGSFSLSDFGSSVVNSFDDLSVGLFARDGVGYYGYFATTSQTAPGATGNLGNFLTASNSVMNNYGAAATKTVKAATATNSYWKKMNNNSTPGLYGLLSRDVANGEAVLPEEGFVDMYLYKYQTATDPGVGSYLASFRIFTDGSIVMNAGSSPVPVPGAFILLFSGLLGLVGIRRKA